MSIRIELKRAAYQEWQRRIAVSPTPAHSALWIGYDTDGCGCAVNGVIIVRFIENRDSLPRAETWVHAEVRIESDHANDSTDSDDGTDSISKASTFLPNVLYEPRSEWVFDDEMRLDYDPASSRYQLRSNNQIFCI
jgi:uncharacterized protein YqkB